MPGLRPGARLVSASVLGVAYVYAMADEEYSPDWVYVTADEGSARAYASRCLDRIGRPVGVAVVLAENRADTAE
nr:hypothetical protein [Pseudonocardia alni]